MPRLERKLKGHDTSLYITAQAREIIKFYGINEERFIQKLLELFHECFANLEYPAHRITVSKSSFIEPDVPSLQIEILDYSKKFPIKEASSS